VRTPQDIFLVVQTPNREGPGHEFLVARMELSEFDRTMWKKGKSDELILALALMSQQGIGHWRANIGMKTFVRSIREEYEIQQAVKRVKLDFVLPTPIEVANAALRRNRNAVAEQITALEERINGCNRFIASTEAMLDGYRVYLKQPNLLSGIRLHFERVLIADGTKHLHDVKKERERTYRELKQANALQKKFRNTKET